MGLKMFEFFLIILVIIGGFFSFINLCLLIFLIQLCVKNYEMNKDFFSDVMILFANDKEISEIPTIAKSKTWDEKFEEELDARERRLRENRDGLLDILPPKANYGMPPASDLDAQAGLEFKK